MKKLAVILLFIGVFFAEDKINWQKTDKALKDARVQKKMVLLYVKTNWCAFCRKLNAEAFADKKIQKLINKNFIPAKIDAENKIEIVNCDNKIYTAKDFCKIVGVKSYPSILFLDKDGKPVASLKGYYSKNEIKQALEFIINGRK